LGVKETLVALVRARRKELGWSQRELARALGSSPSRISKLEGGDPSVAVDLVLRALEAMALPLEVVGDDDADPMKQPSLDEHARHRLSRELLRRAIARRLAARDGVDEGDVRRALANLELTPAQRLTRMFQRAQLREHAIH
jgi:transcriptional regulator with XRE-family HTH domain